MENFTAFVKRISWWVVIAFILVAVSAGHLIFGAVALAAYYLGAAIFALLLSTRE